MATDKAQRSDSKCVNEKEIKTFYHCKNCTAILNTGG